MKFSSEKWSFQHSCPAKSFLINLTRVANPNQKDPNNFGCKVQHFVNLNLCSSKAKTKINFLKCFTKIGLYVLLFSYVIKLFNSTFVHKLIFGSRSC